MLRNPTFKVSDCYISDFMRKVSIIFIFPCSLQILHSIFLITLIILKNAVLALKCAAAITETF